MDPWLVDLVVVRNASHDGGERRSLTRDVSNGRRTRIRQGVYAEAETWTALEPEEQQIVATRALDAVSEVRPVFSHWSAALLHELPFMEHGSARIHTTVPDAALRGLAGVAGHVYAIRQEEVVEVHGLLVTGIARTVIDVAGASAFDDGVVIADGALAAGLPRELLEQAIDLAGPRRGEVRATQVVAFAHPGGESAAESKSKNTMFRLGVEPPELQHEVWDGRGLAGVVDTWWQRYRAAGEIDGARKYLDPRLAGRGAGRAVYDEKRREDRVLLEADRLARWGWKESCSGVLLRPILARLGVRPLANRPTLADWAALARSAVPRRPRIVLPTSAASATARAIADAAGMGTRVNGPRRRASRCGSPP